MTISFKSKLSLVSILLTFLIVSASQNYAQKAMPKRINFAKGKTSRTVTGKLSNNQEYDFVVGAKKGQLLQVSITSRPRGKFNSFSILGADGVDFTTEFDVNYAVKRRLPATGDYLITVVKRPTKRVRTARFYLTVRITR